jgi:hypothetical protein
MNRFSPAPIFLICLSILAACSAPPPVPLVVSQQSTALAAQYATALAKTTTPYAADSTPIVLMRQTGKSVHFTCLNTSRCYPAIADLTFQDIDVFQCILDSQGNLYLPLHWAADRKHEHSAANLLLVDAENGALDWISFAEQGLSAPRNTSLTPFIVQSGEITFADGADNLYGVKQDHTVRQLSLPDSQTASANAPMLDLNAIPAHDLVIPILADHLNGKPAGLFYLIDTKTGSVNSRLIPLPEFEIPPYPDALEAGKKYAVKIEALSRDLKMVYLSYSTGLDPANKTATVRVSRYDWTAGTESEAPDATSYSIYHDVLFLPTSGDFIQTGTAPRLMLRGADWQPLEAIPIIWALMPASSFTDDGIQIQIHPFGNGFLVGTKETIYQVSAEGKIIEEYAVPEKDQAQSYFLSQYQN